MPCPSGPVLAAVLVGLPFIALVNPADIRALTVAGPSLADVDGESRRLDALTELARKRTAVRTALLAELAAGHTTLAEATDTSLALFAADPTCLPVMRHEFRGDTDRERVARNTAARAMNTVGDPEPRAQVGERLAAEFRAMFPDAAPLEL